MPWRARNGRGRRHPDDRDGGTAAPLEPVDRGLWLWPWIRVPPGSAQHIAKGARIPHKPPEGRTCRQRRVMIHDDTHQPALAGGFQHRFKLAFWLAPSAPLASSGAVGMPETYADQGHAGPDPHVRKGGSGKIIAAHVGAELRSIAS